MRPSGYVDGEVTIKRFERVGDVVRLLPRNPAYKPGVSSTLIRTSTSKECSAVW